MRVYGVEFGKMDVTSLLLSENSILKYLIMKRRKYWVNDLYARRGEESEYVKLFDELKQQPAKFFEYFRMSSSTFNYILNRIKPRIQKYSNFRECIGPREKLTITLRYLSTGLAFRSLSFSFRMSHTTIRKVIYEVCQATWDEFYQEHMPFPTIERHLSIANDFFLRWNFPNCIGCIDGKHIRIRAPPDSGSMFWNYKQFHSIVLQAVSDAHCRFLYIDVGAYGKQSDGGIFSASSLMHHIENESFNVPSKRKIPDTDIIAPFVLLGDEAYPLKIYLMRPYSGRSLDQQQEVYNYRLSRARRIVECAFGILSAKWRILKKEIECHPGKAELIIKCTCILHNIIIDKEGVNSGIDGQTNFDLSQMVHQVSSRSNNRSTVAAYNVREIFKNYFNNPLGSVPFQNAYVTNK